MLDQHQVYYTAMKSRDARFDGRFFIGVHTTGIYCRPVCPAPNPKPQNVTFYQSAAAASKAGYRPCLRCRPESSPGTPEWDANSAVVSQALRMITNGYLNENRVEELAEEMHISTRQLRRLFEDNLGASPNEVAQTQRLHFAKKLITETNLAMTEVAFSSGFSSVRRFNAVVQSTYGRKPKELRNRKRGKVEEGSLKLSLAYRPPYDWEGIIGFMQGREIAGVELVTNRYYRRSVCFGTDSGVIEVSPIKDKIVLELKVSAGLTKHLGKIVQRVKRMFDLNAFPDEINMSLHNSSALADSISAHPGTRLPGAWDGFEVTIRAILGQQVSVKAANTLAGRLVSRYGDELPEPNGSGLTHLFPTAKSLLEADFAEIGLTKARQNTIRAVAKAVLDGDLQFGVYTSPEELIEQLMRVKGVGPWTAEYVAMRALGAPDAFPTSDLGLRKAMSNGSGLMGTAELQKIAENWRPWRSYAAIHLWASLSEKPDTSA